MLKIQTLNKISAKGLDKFPREDYEVASSIQDADAILVRSQDMHGMELPGTVKAVARAGAGTNNIPIEELTKKGIVVFNTPGANANAVKELVILSILLASSTKSAPDFAKPSAICLPKPLDAPVITATLPFKLNILSTSFFIYIFNCF